MSKEQTDLSRYKSPSTGDYCTSAQYIAELMCQRMAERTNEGSLAYKFWNTKKWKKTYQLQVIAANRLLNKYSDRAIVAALNTYKGLKIYSLRFPGLEEMIKTEHRRLDNGPPVKSDSYENNTSSKPMKPYGKKSKIEKLRELDG